MFSVVTEAQQKHEAGLQAELSGNYQEAHEAFATAQRYLAELPPTIDVDVQSARIDRDNGFTYVRSAIKRNDQEDLDEADDVLDAAGGKTLLWTLKAGNSSPGPEASVRLSFTQWRELFAEHGATISLMARVATVREIMTGKKDEYNPPSETYKTAGRHLVLGSNGYYLVSNALVAARHERINGNLSGTTSWLGMAATGVVLTAALDIRNLRRASETFVSRTRHLRSRSIAAQSVTEKP